MSKRLTEKWDIGQDSTVRFMKSTEQLELAPFRADVKKRATTVAVPLIGVYLERRTCPIESAGPRIPR